MQNLPIDDSIRCPPEFYDKNETNNQKQQQQQQLQQQQQQQQQQYQQQQQQQQMMWSSYQSKQERDQAFKEQKNTLEKSLKLSVNNEYQPITLTFQIQNQEDQEDQEDIDVIITPDDQKNGIHVIKDFKQHFKLFEVIGEGNVGITYKGKKFKNGATYAVKYVKVLDRKTIYNIKHDFFKIKNLRHPYIVQTYEMYIEDDQKAAKKIYIIMEYITCQKLFDVIDESSLTEELTKKIFLKILTGIQYMHGQGVCHRDLKPDNILADKTGTQVKILDFNIAKFSDDYKAVGPLKKYQIPMHTYIGTLEFSAPEIFTEEEYYESCDIWSAGVILFTMLSRSLPFFCEFIHELIDQIQAGIYEMPDDPWLFISQQAKDLVSRCLTVDVQKRITIEEAIKHGFFFEKGTKLNDGSDSDSSGSQSQILKKSLRKEEIIKNTILQKKLQSSQINKSEENSNQLPIEAFLFNDKNVFITKKLEKNLTQSLYDLNKIHNDINNLGTNEVSQIISVQKNKMLQSADQIFNAQVSQSLMFGQKKGMANQSSINKPQITQCDKIMENNFETTGDSEKNQ